MALTRNFALRQGGADEELEFGAEQPHAVRAGHGERAHIVAQASVHHHLNAGATAGEGLDVLQCGIGRLLLAALGKARLEGVGDLRQRADDGAACRGIEQDFVTFADGGAHAFGPPDDGDVHGPRDDHDVGGQ